jgi:hypothetical protein
MLHACVQRFDVTGTAQTFFLALFCQLGPKKESSYEDPKTLERGYVGAKLSHRNQIKQWQQFLLSWIVWAFGDRFIFVGFKFSPAQNSGLKWFWILIRYEPCWAESCREAHVSYHSPHVATVYHLSHPINCVCSWWIWCVWLRERFLQTADPTFVFIFLKKPTASFTLQIFLTGWIVPLSSYLVNIVQSWIN